MSGRWTSTLIVAFAWLLVLAAFLIPSAAIVLTCILDGAAPQGGFTYSARQLGLVLRTVLMAGSATILALLLSIPAVITFGRRRIDRVGISILTACAIVLLTPPMVYAFGWERITPKWISPYVRCVGVWSLWAWPIATAVIGAGWSRVGSSAYEHALLSTTPASAFLRIGLPAIRPHIALSAVLLFVLFFNDYGTPQACGLIVYGVELLGWAGSSSRAIDTLWPALPSVTVTLVLFAFAIRWAGTASDRSDSESNHPPESRRRIVWHLAIVLVVGLSWAAPLSAFVADLASIAALEESLRVYGRDLIWSLGVATVAGIMAMLMGIGVWFARVGAKVIALWSIAFGLLPAAIVGRSMIASYNHAATAALYDHWPILVLVYVARFGWIGIAAAWVVMNRTPRNLTDQARTDGAPPWAEWMHIRLRMSWPTAVAVVAIVAAQSVAEAAASTLVRTPDFSPISHVIIEKFHRFETDLLISLSVWTVATAIPGAVLLSFAVRRSRRT